MKNVGMAKTVCSRVRTLADNVQFNHPELTVGIQAKQMGMSYSTFNKYIETDNIDRRQISEPSASKLKTMADYYDVSVDYLVGGTNFKGTDKNARSAAEYTGLSEKAIDVLRNCSTNNSKGKQRLYAFSKLVEHPKFLDLLDGLDFCNNFASWNDDLSIAVDIIAEGTGRIIDKNTKERISHFRSTGRKATVFDIQRIMADIASDLIAESETAEQQKTASGAGSTENGQGQNEAPDL